MTLHAVRFFDGESAAHEPVLPKLTELASVYLGAHKVCAVHMHHQHYLPHDLT